MHISDPLFITDAPMSFPAFVMFFLALLTLVGLITLILIGVIFLVRGFQRRRDDINSKDQVAVLQEMNQMAQRLEKRIDSLETIFFESLSNKRRDPTNKSDR